LIKWLFYFTENARTNFVQRFLEANDIRFYKSSKSIMSSNGNHDDDLPRKYLNDFIEHYCRQDGLLLLRIIKKNTNNVIAGEIICALWDNWKVTPQISLRDNNMRITDFGGDSPLKPKDLGDVNEKLLPRM